MDSLESRFISFLKEQPDAESIDDTFTEMDLGNGKRADFLLNNRRIILEIKSLESDPEYKVQEHLLQHQNRPDYPTFYGTVALKDILDRLPDGKAIMLKITAAVTKSIQYGIENGDDQIRDTKSVLGLAEATGVLVFLNQNIGILSPEVFVRKISEMLSKKRDSELRYKEIAYVMLISECHRVVPSLGQEMLPLLEVSNPHVAGNRDTEDYLKLLRRKWSDSQGIPLVEYTGNATNINFEKRSRQEERTGESRQEVWRKAYRQQPYLKSMPEDVFINHATHVIETIAPYFIKGGPKPTEHHFEIFGQVWTHVLEEANHRKLDMKKVQAKLDLGEVLGLVKGCKDGWSSDNS